MKTLIISSLVLGILAAYFIFNTERSISVKGLLTGKEGFGNAIPAGTDIAKFVLDQAKALIPEISGNNILQSGIAEEIKSKIGDVKNNILDEAINLIKKPIENKIIEVVCPVK